MSSFTKASGFLPLPKTEGKKRWMVTEEFYWYFNDPSEGTGILVPKGFKFNGADIPFPVSAIWPKIHPDYMQSAALHDYCLEQLRSLFTRDFIDQQFYESLLVLNNPKWKSWCMYQAVRNFGIVLERKNYWKLTNA